MPGPSSTQLRLLYSLLKPAVRVAARFRVPVRTVGELLRLAYFEELRRKGLSHAEIAGRLGQTERNMRMLERKLKGEFFAAETEIGLVREVEDFIASCGPSQRRLLKHLSASWEEHEILSALDVLIKEGRVERRDKRLVPTRKYVTLTSADFRQRIDALNHFLDAVTRSVIQRLVHDEKRNAMMKTVSFDADPGAFEEFRNRFESDLRRDIAALEESAGQAGTVRYVLGVNVATQED